MVYEVGAVYEICGIQENMATNCQTSYQEVQQASAFQNFNQRPQNNPLFQ